MHDACSILELAAFCSVTVYKMWSMGVIVLGFIIFVELCIRIYTVQ